ncbi:MAG: BrnT family toxin [Acidobacteriota bacterium]|nr:BrnT family toxin [Acidobacteriota bacterium]
MKICYDLAKDAANIGKHGVSLAMAAELEWDTLWAMPDTRRSYGETRFIGYAVFARRLYCVVFTDRDWQRRVISLRKANAREVRRYAENA